MFAFWTADQLKTAIVTMEQQLATGASQIASPTEGSATLLHRRDADIVLARLYRAYERATGTVVPRDKLPTQIKTYQINVRSDL